MNNKFVFIGVALVILVIAGLSYRFFAATPPSQTNLSPTVTAQQENLPTAAPTTQQTLEQGGSSYLNPQGVFSFLYPNDYTLDTSDPKHIRIYKRGETQRPQSEMSDGALIVFEQVSLQNNPLETWVDARIKESTADGTSEVVEPKKAIVQNTYPGFSYTLRGLGTSQNIILQKNKDSNNAVLITYSISDPKQKGYQKEVDATLSSLKLLK